jgi:hypothetical protein
MQWVLSSENVEVFTLLTCAFRQQVLVSESADINQEGKTPAPKLPVDEGVRITYLTAAPAALLLPTDEQLMELRSIVLKHRPKLAPHGSGKFGYQDEIEFDRGIVGACQVARDRRSSRRDQSPRRSFLLVRQRRAISKIARHARDNPRQRTHGRRVAWGDKLADTN